MGSLVADLWRSPKQRIDKNDRLKSSNKYVFLNQVNDGKSMIFLAKDALSK